MAKEEKEPVPTWMYDPKTGEGECFDDAGDAPKGWVDSPAKVKKSKG